MVPPVPLIPTDDSKDDYSDPESYNDCSDDSDGFLERLQRITESDVQVPLPQARVQEPPAAAAAAAAAPPSAIWSGDTRGICQYRLRQPSRLRSGRPYFGAAAEANFPREPHNRNPSSCMCMWNQHWGYRVSAGLLLMADSRRSTEGQDGSYLRILEFPRNNFSPELLKDDKKFQRFSSSSLNVLGVLLDPKRQVVHVRSAGALDRTLLLYSSDCHQEDGGPYTLQVVRNPTGYVAVSAPRAGLCFRIMAILSCKDESAIQAIINDTHIVSDNLRQMAESYLMHLDHTWHRRLDRSFLLLQIDRSPSPPGDYESGGQSLATGSSEDADYNNCPLTDNASPSAAIAIPSTPKSSVEDSKPLTTQPWRFTQRQSLKTLHHVRLAPLDEPGGGAQFGEVAMKNIPFPAKTGRSITKLSKTQTHWGYYVKQRALIFSAGLLRVENNTVRTAERRKEIKQIVMNMAKDPGRERLVSLAMVDEAIALLIDATQGQLLVRTWGEEVPFKVYVYKRLKGGEASVPVPISCSNGLAVEELSEGLVIALVCSAASADAIRQWRRAPVTDLSDLPQLAESIVASLPPAVARDNSTRCRNPKPRVTLAALLRITRLAGDGNGVDETRAV